MKTGVFNNPVPITSRQSKSKGIRRFVKFNEMSYFFIMRYFIEYQS